jgi:hypothetical protein
MPKLILPPFPKYCCWLVQNELASDNILETEGVLYCVAAFSECPSLALR